MKKIIIFIMMFVLVLGITSSQAEAKSKTLKLNKKKVEMEVGDKIKISVKNGTPKKVKWTVNAKGKKVVELSQKSKKSVKIKGKKNGTATVTARITYKKKTKKLKVKIKVTAANKGKNSVNLIMKKQIAFPGKVKVSLDASGYAKIQWDKVSNAHAYVIQRKAGDDTWSDLKVTSARTYTDRTVGEYTVYAYRVRANCNGMCTAYSTAVTIQTGKVKSVYDTSDILVTSTPEPTQEPVATPEPVPEPTPYKPKYSYEVEVLNQFTIYENVPIALYVKTDNPNPNCTSDDLGSVYVSFGGDYTGGQICTFEDVQYIDEEEATSTFFKKVNGGWIYSLWFSSSGVKNVEIKERGNFVSSFQIVVNNGESALQQYCNDIIKEVSNDNYNEDERGKWSDLIETERMERIEDYVRGHLNYPRLGPLTSLGYLPVWYIQENVGAYWETGFADCGAANDMVCVLARILGYEAELRNTTLNGVLHIQAIVTIDGVEHTYDATPWQGGYKDWDYIL